MYSGRGRRVEEEKNVWFWVFGNVWGEGFVIGIFLYSQSSFVSFVNGKGSL
jgi:hypothetical protein